VASSKEPYLGLRLILDPAVVTSTMVEAGLVHWQNDSGVKAIAVKALDPDLLNACLRLARQLQMPELPHLKLPTSGWSREWSRIGRYRMSDRYEESLWLANSFVPEGRSKSGVSRPTIRPFIDLSPDEARLKSQ
jgi:hypothetical protein